MNEKIRKYVLPNLPYLLFFWFFIQVGEAFRLAPGEEIGKKVLGLAVGFSQAFETFPPTHPVDLIVGVIGAAAVRLAVYVKGKNAKKYRKDEEYGSARWGTPEDIKPFMDEKPENNIILTETEGLMMSGRPKDPKYARNKNVLVVGGSGSGKTRFFIKPNLMQCDSKDYPVSFVVTDPKGTLVLECGKLLRRKGYKVKIFNTINLKKSMHYNPLAYVHDEKDILKLVTGLIANTKGDQKGGDQFWEQAETLLLLALLSFICTQAPENERNLGTLLEMLNAMEVRDNEQTFKNAVDLMFDDLTEREPDHFAVKQYAKYKLAAGKTAKSILISAASRLAILEIPAIKELVSYDELELDTLGDTKTALFFIISDTDSSLNFLVSMAYTQLFNLLCEKADDVYGGRLPIHVRCLIDEAANIGQIPQLDKLVATIRSREISACLVLQAQSQLKTFYKDAADTIIGNMDSLLFLGGKEESTLKSLNAALGKATIDSFNTSVTKGQQESHGQNFQKLGRDLLTVDEIQKMDGGKCLLLIRGAPPFFSKKYNLLRHKYYRYLSDADPKNTFNVQKYLSTRLKVKPDDEFYVFDV